MRKLVFMAWKGNAVRLVVTTCLYFPYTMIMYKETVYFKGKDCIFLTGSVQK